MAQKSEMFKIIHDQEQEENRDSKEEKKEGGLIKLEPGQSESLGFPNVRALMRPVQEAEVSLARVDQHLVTINEIDPQALSQYSRLATALIVAAIKNPPLKRILIASAHHSEGRTCVLLNLAVALAKAKKRVLVVDTDLMRPSVGRLLGVDTEIGLVEALTEGVAPEATITRVSPIGFDILPTRAQFLNSAELLASGDFPRFIAEIDSYYDFILFDSAPLLSSADASLLILNTHTTIMVVRPGVTTTEQMSKAIAMMSEESLFGVVMNRVPK
ncbi:MAG: CpsD/CapB family tyrosine-protein kinase [Acidobacteria bacterium]|nr:CpsD/CapB family tyrosine-protein kinase [Acidobacteriota bacterium]